MNVAVVTGGAKGIGREIVKMLALNNMKVVAIYNNSEKEAIELREELKQFKKDITILKADVSKREEVEKVVDEIITKYEKIDILVNNAGVSEYKMFCDSNDDDWNRIINNNLYSAFICSQYVLENMVKNKNGSIINISSIWGLIGSSMEVIYSISKAGMDGMTKALAKEYGASNIRINSIAPGIIETDMVKELSSNIKKDIENQIPLEKIGKPEDVAKCVKWLVTDEYTTGQIISINGGWAM